jgi:hypothetical protein
MGVKGPAALRCRRRPDRRLLARWCGAFGLVGSRVVLLLRVAKGSQVRADPLRAWLPNMEPGADHADRGHPPRRHLTRERLSSPHPQPAIARSARWSRSGRRASREPARADDHHEQLLRTDQRDRRPRSHDRTRGPMAKAVRDAGRERGGDPHARQPPRQRRNPHLPPRRVEHHHRAGVDQPIHRQRHQPARPPRLAVRPDQGTGVLVGRNRSDSRDTDYRPRGRPPNDPIGRVTGHRQAQTPWSARSHENVQSVGLGPRTQIPAHFPRFSTRLNTWPCDFPSGEISPACVVKRRFKCRDGREIPRKRIA